jgi:Adenylate and Guanylate cyclase catalytic domain
MVFYLLENIYCEFDRIAEAHNVFKVETIGDCCKWYDWLGMRNLLHVTNR